MDYEWILASDRVPPVNTPVNTRTQLMVHTWAIHDGANWINARTGQPMVEVYEWETNESAH